MKKELNNKLSALDPRFQKKIQEIFSSMNESISFLYEAATRDEKTGLYNNKFLNNIFDMELEKAKRKQQNLSVLILDIDFFKKVNDTYGHVKADEILKELARVILVQTRKCDIASRFGGEEFVVLLPETNLNKAKKFATRLRNAIKNDSFLKKYKLTVSGGITEFKNRDTKKRMLDRADKALYLAKKNGRDRIEIKE